MAGTNTFIVDHEMYLVYTCADIIRLKWLASQIVCLHGAFHCGLIVAFGRLWLFIC